jgi:hypothetical protein
MGPCGASQRLIAQGSAPKLGDLGLGRYVRGRLCISPDVNFTVFKAMIDLSPLTRMIDKKRATRSNHDSSRVPRRRLAFRRAPGSDSQRRRSYPRRRHEAFRKITAAAHDDFDSFERPSSRESIATLRTSARPPRAVRARKASEFGARSHLARSTFRAKGLSRWLPRASWTRSRTRKSR